ncbi:MAG: hypothetical protein JJV93_01825 [Alphaproteobacteria bacterium]|nr:hypothetical protein [Alphaproteobacteria bacterium]
MFKKTKNGWRVFSKQYFLQDDHGNERRLKARTIIDLIGNRQGTEHSKQLFGNENKFSNPKPEQLIEFYLQIATQPGDIVLDFFNFSLGTKIQNFYNTNLYFAL